VIATWNTAGLEAGQYLLKLVITDNWGNSAEAIKGIMLLPAFGINEIVEAGVYIYPNPATDKIYLQFPQNQSNAVLCIYDMVGKMMIRKDIPEGIQNRDIEISVEMLKPGFYSMGIFTGNRWYFSKLVVK
jgi:hypothetical protein